jgi:hypothetical protein
MLVWMFNINMNEFAVLLLVVMLLMFKWNAIGKVLFASASAHSLSLIVVQGGSVLRSMFVSSEI